MLLPTDEILSYDSAHFDTNTVYETRAKFILVFSVWLMSVIDTDLLFLGASPLPSSRLSGDYHNDWAGSHRRT